MAIINLKSGLGTQSQRSDLQGSAYFQNLLERGTPAEKQAATNWFARQKKNQVQNLFNKPTISSVNKGSAPVVQSGGGSPYNIPTSTGSGGYSSSTNTTQTKNPTMNFTSALMKILKDAQVQQQAGQAGLMKQQQDITGTGLDMANQINTGDIEQLNPESIVGLRRGAIGAVAPGELSVENQLRLSNAGFANVNDLIEKTLGSYEKEQERVLQQQQYESDQAFKERQLAEQIRSNKVGESLSYSKLTSENGTGGVSPYAQERATRNIQSVDDLIGRTSRWTTGFGSWLSGIPETDATNFASDLDTLRANIAFGELTAMREASKTGGALGAVSERELGLLESALGALNTKQSPSSFKSNLQKIKDSIIRWNSIAGGSISTTGSTLPSGTGTTSTGLTYTITQ